MKHYAIRENHLYAKAYAKGRRFVTPTVAVYVLKDYHATRLKKENPQKAYINRIGLTVTKKLGGAVSRNRCKRIMREALRHIEKEYKPKTGFLVVIAARDAAVRAHTADIETDLHRALAALGLLL